MLQYITTFVCVPQMWMNVPFGTMDVLLVVKTSQGLISVPALKDMLSFQTGRLVKVGNTVIVEQPISILLLHSIKFLLKSVDFDFMMVFITSMVKPL